MPLFYQISFPLNKNFFEPALAPGMNTLEVVY